MGYTPYSGAFDKKLGEFLAQPVDYTRYYNQGGAATPPPAAAASAATAQRSQVDIPEWMNEEILNIPEEQREAFLNEYGARIDQNVNVNHGRDADATNRAAMRGWVAEWKNSGRYDPHTGTKLNLPGSTNPTERGTSTQFKIGTNGKLVGKVVGIALPFPGGSFAGGWLGKYLGNEYLNNKVWQSDGTSGGQYDYWKGEGPNPGPVPSTGGGILDPMAESDAFNAEARANSSPVEHGMIAEGRGFGGYDGGRFGGMGGGQGYGGYSGGGGMSYTGTHIKSSH